MFLPIHIESKNSRSSLQAGKYEARCRVYKSRNEEAFAHLYEYRIEGTSEILAYDLMMQLPDKSQFFVDYGKLPDGMWMDSSGLKSSSIASLLPVEILDYSLLNEYLSGYINLDGDQNGK